MTTIDRRALLGSLLGGAAVAATGLAFSLDAAESAPLTMGAVEKAVVVVRRRRVRRCWWRHGHRVCRWV